MLDRIKKNRLEARLSGSGGQGLILSGIILARAAVYDNRHVTQTQSYGPESRGGASRADVIISQNEIFYPEATALDVFVALTQEACDKYLYDLKDDGILIVDTTFVKNVSIFGVPIYELPFTEIAVEKLGTKLPTNIIVLSFLVKKTKIVTQKSLESAIKQSVKPAYVDLNIKAMNLGFKLAKETKKES